MSGDRRQPTDRRRTPAHRRRAARRAKLPLAAGSPCVGAVALAPWSWVPSAAGS